LLAREGVSALAREHGTAVVTRAVRELVDDARASIVATGSAEPIDDARIADRARSIARTPLVPVLNATGVIVHTNLGRVPIARAALDAAKRIGEGYSTLEYDLALGRRGHRHAHVRDALIALTGAEDAIVVNNNAAAMLLALGTLARGKSAIVSRGELVEIGGGFRIPDVIGEAGAHLVEVGTTNRTHLRDYEHAIDDRVALLLKVHRSNFEMTGFVAEAGIGALADLAHAHGLALVHDAGSGCMAPIAEAVKEPTIASQITAGADLVCFSGDKLLGGPQAGIVVGRHALIERMRSAPLYRALRPDKLTLAALGATLALWRDEPDALPIVRMLRASVDALADRATRLIAAIDARGATLDVAPAIGRIGGGAAPAVELASCALRVRGVDAGALARRLRDGTPHVVARVDDDAVWLDLRCIDASDDDALARALGDALAT
jgi:L-seryl-tRNA(Ser) seleniumtransferase